MAPSGKDKTGEDQHGIIFSISGPVVVAEHMIGCAMYELVGIIDASL
jgi:V-type H+-transporting ATPase subunit A